MNTKKTLLAVLVAGLVSMPVLADDMDKKGNNECPVGLVSGMSLDEEFGPGTSDITKCIKKRHQVKMVVQINQLGTSTRPFALGNIENIIADYEITHGMVRGRDYEIVAVIHSGGGFMALTNDGYNGSGQWVTGRNPAQSKVEALMAKGVKFYFCQNTTRAYLGTALPAGNATAELIPGMLYTTAGLTSIADFQAQGYQYIQP